MSSRCTPFLLAIALTLGACSDSTGPDPGPGPFPKQGFVAVAPGVRLEYLDFGGDGQPVVFLAGLGNTAHIFEDFAPPFTNHFRVLAITRRGFGASSQPTSGYDTRSLSEDILAVLDTLGLAQVDFVGHSLAGDEMTRFAGDHPDRARRLVYLDAGYDRPALYALAIAHPFPTPPAITAQDLGSIDAFARYLATVYGVMFPNAEIRATTLFAADGSVDDVVTPSSVSAAIQAHEESPDYSRVAAPALGIYAVPVVASDLASWLTPASPDWGPTEALLNGFLGPFYQAQRDRFDQEVTTSTVIGIAGARHHLFLSNPDEVASAVRSFLESP